MERLPITTAAMRPSFTALLIALMLAASPAPSADPPTQYTTDVKGTVPDLNGRWFAVSHIAVPGNAQGTVTVATFWDVATVDGKTAFSLHYVQPPQAMREAMRQANLDRRPWNPSPEDLAALRDGWATLEPEQRGAAKVATTITGRDGFTDVLANDEAMKDAQWVVQISVDYTPGPQRPMKDVMLYGAKESLPDGWSGAYASATIAGAPVPIPIAFKGTFRTYRLNAPSSGLLARLFGMFSGCGRTKTP